MWIIAIVLLIVVLYQLDAVRAVLDIKAKNQDEDK